MRAEEQKYSHARWGYMLFSGFVDTILVRQQVKLNDTINNYVLAHYSSSRKGSAYYYQQLRFSRLLRARHALEYYKVPALLKPAIFNRLSPQSGRRFASVTNTFTSYYYFLTTNRQLRSTLTPLAHNRSRSPYFLGTAAAGTLNNSVFAKTRRGASIRGGHHHTFFRWAALQQHFYTFAHTAVTTSKERGCETNLATRSLLRFRYATTFNRLQSPQLTNNWLLGFWSGSLMESVLRLTASLTYFVRTVWFRLTFNIAQVVLQKNHTEHGSRVHRGVLTLGAFSGAFANTDGSYYALPALAQWPNESVDPGRTSKSPTSARKRRFFNRKHYTFRIGLGFWGKKLWQFRKSRRFWNYIRSVYRYMFRSFKTFNVFQNRLDVFVLRFFAIRSILYSRSLIKAGHVFVGNYNPRNPRFQVERHALVTLSRKATIWTAGRSPLLKARYKDSAEEVRHLRRVSQTGALRYARQQADLFMFGGTKFRKYAMYYGEPLDLLFAQNRKTKFFSLNFFYAQKTVNSAWW